MIKQTPELKQKKVSARITIYTDHKIIEGNVHAFPTMRLTDLLNNADSFIPLTDAVIYDLRGQEEVTHTPFVSINKNVINLVLEK